MKNSIQLVNFENMFLYYEHHEREIWRVRYLSITVVTIDIVQNSKIYGNKEVYRI